MCCGAFGLCISIKFCMFHESMSFRLSDGTVLNAEVHPSWRLQQPVFKITAFDLASAYKQLPLNPKEYNCTMVSLRSPKDDAVKCFYMRTLPFGSIASVVHFNRISRLLWRLGLALGILWGNYFDDFPLASPMLPMPPRQWLVFKAFSNYWVLYLRKTSSSLLRTMPKCWGYW